MHSGGLPASQRYLVVVLLVDSEAESVAVADLLTLPTCDLQLVWCP